MSQATARTAQDPASLTADLLLRLGFAVLTIVIPVTASFSRRAIFILLPFGSAMILIASAIAPANGGGDRLKRAMFSVTGMAVFVLILWAALSMLWVPYPVDAAQRLFKLVATLLLTAGGVALLPPRMRVSSIYFLPLGLALAVLVVFGLAAAGLRVTGSPESDAFTLERTIITLVIMVWPAMAALIARQRWSSVVAIACGVVAAAAVAGNGLALFALAVGTTAALAVRFRARTSGLVLMIVTFLLFMLAPPLPFIIELVTNLFVSRPPDWLTPITAWQQIVADDVPRLLTGHGLETVSHGIGSYLPQRTPRSVLFQVWYELGFVGAFATAFCLARGVLLASRTGDGSAPYLMGALTAALTLAVFSQNFEQIWWVCLLGVAAICFAGVINAQHRTRRPAARIPIAAPRPPAP